MKRRLTFILVAMMWFCVAVRTDQAIGQTANDKQAKTAQPRPEDVTTLDGIIRAFYEVISGPAGTPRQWERDRTLYIPGVRFVAIETEHGKPMARVMTHDEYVRQADAGMVKGGFFEREIHREVRRYGDMAQVFSTYEWRQVSDGPVKGRGINSVEAFFDGKRWWIASATWQDETPENPLPKAYLP